MNKLTKGAIATAAGVTLLLGGAGTFALWNDAIDGTSIGTVNTGYLHFADEGAVTGEWHYVVGEVRGEKIEDFTNFVMVPGETIEYVGTVRLRAEGTNLHAKLTLDKNSTPIPEPLTVTFAGGSDVIDIPSAANMRDQQVVVRVTFPDQGTGPNTENPPNNGQGASLNLSDLKFTLNQTAP